MQRDVCNILYECVCTKYADAYRKFCDFSTRQKTLSAGTCTLLIVGTERVRNFGKISHAPERMLGQIPYAMRDKAVKIATANGSHKFLARVIKFIEKLNKFLKKFNIYSNSLMYILLINVLISYIHLHLIVLLT